MSQPVENVVPARKPRGTKPPRTIDPNLLTQFPSVQAGSCEPVYAMRAIGVFRSVWNEKHGCPRQGSVSEHSRGWLQLDSSYPRDILEGLQQFSHVWLLFIFHLNDNISLKIKVRPPRMTGGDTDNTNGRMGALACRSPHRPNPIGQTVAQLLDVDIANRRVRVTGIDLVDNTPIVDIKPYHVSDSIALSSLRMPGWISSTNKPEGHDNDAEQLPQLTVRWTRLARLQFDQSTHLLIHYDATSPVDLECAIDAINQSLAADPRSRHSRADHSVDSISGIPPIYGLAFDALNITYSVQSIDTGVIALIFDVQGFKQRAPSSSSSESRPRMRTAEWLQQMQQVYRQLVDTNQLYQHVDNINN